MGRLLDITPSKLGQAAACIRSTDLENRARRVTPWAGRGTVLHSVAEKAETAGWGAALDAIPATVDAATRRLAELCDLPALNETLGRGKFTWGAGVVWCLQTGEGVILGTGLTRERAHELARAFVATREGDWLVGLVDLAGVVPVGELKGIQVVVPDLKTGHVKPDDAVVCWQTRAYAVMLWAALNATAALHGPLWMPDGQKPRWEDPEKLDAGGLLEAEHQLRRLLLEVQRVQALPVEQRPAPEYGDHCRYCEHVHHCEARTQAVLRFGEGLERTADGKFLITAENAPLIYQRITLSRELLDLAEEGLKLFAEVNGAFEIGKGKLCGQYVHEERKVSPGAVYPALVRLGVPPDKAQELVRTVTKQSVPLGGLEAAYIEHVYPKPEERHGKGAELKRELAKALGDGLKTRTEIRNGSHWPKQTYLPDRERGEQEMEATCKSTS